MATETTFTTVYDETDGEEWPDGTHDRHTLVEGELAESVLRRAGLDGGRVVILEHGQEGGYSEYTVEWDYDFRVEVDGTEVFASNTPNYSTVDLGAAGIGRAAYHRNGLTDFLNWLHEPPA